MSAGGYRDYFNILGVDRSASSESIKKAFRKLARQFHPDVNPGDLTAEAKFKEISEAYEVLSDPEKRRKYEQFGKYWNQAGGMGAGASSFDVDFGRYGNFDEFINDLLGRFGGVRGASGFPSGSGYSKGFAGTSINLDANVKVKISFKEAFHGTERTLSVNEERIQVTIPQGVRSGSRLRLKGKGNLQPGTGRRGDLFLQIEVQPHSIWYFDGDQLRAHLPVAFDELVLGGSITVMTPDGAAELSIPAGTLPGQNLRLRGKGWHLGKHRGDLIFTLIINMPREWTDQELRLLKDLKKLRCNEPRKSWLESASL